MMMSIRRVVPNIQSERVEESRKFYVDVLGFEQVMRMDWIATFASPTNPTAQVSIIPGPEPSGMHPNLSVEVDDVDAIHAEAVLRGVRIVYPLTDEPWGVRRFFALDPNGLIVNVVSHRKPSDQA
jgi:catechol 2,3-dioxygenase-like lactoylglutathione lyase family enzyme